MPTLDDLAGTVVGRWTVIRFDGYINKRKAWKCRCECGVEKLVLGENLRTKKTLSCGCWRAEKASVTSARHGYSRVGKRIPEYTIWCGMVQRCTNPNYPEWDDYGGRGITICDEWREDFTKFYEHVGDRPTSKHMIERIDNHKGYQPGNVKWATRIEQANNKRNNVMIEFNGRTLSVAQWSVETGIPYFTLMYRAKKGWSAERALTTPVRPICRH